MNAVQAHTKRPVDIRVENHGSLFLLRWLTPEGENWIADNCGEPEGEHYLNPRQFFGRALVVEPRYVADIVNGAREAGLEVR